MGMGSNSSVILGREAASCELLGLAHELREHGNEICCSLSGSRRGARFLALPMSFESMGMRYAAVFPDLIKNY
jgi:hypothetical protein